MKTSTSSAPAAADPTAKTLDRMTRRAALAYSRAHAAYMRYLAESEFNDNKRLDTLTNVAWDRMYKAEQHLICTILARGEDGDDGFDLSKQVCRTRGVIVDGTLYLAIADRDDRSLPEGSKAINGGVIMELAVMDPANLETL